MKNITLTAEIKSKILRWIRGVTLGMLAFVIRTALEDKTLREELNGYCDFSEQVRYRLIPGIW